MDLGNLDHDEARLPGQRLKAAEGRARPEIESVMLISKATRRQLILT